MPNIIHSISYNLHAHQYGCGGIDRITPDSWNAMWKLKYIATLK